MKSRLPSELVSRRSPELLPAAIAILLVGVVGLQLTLSSGVELPERPRLAPHPVAAETVEADRPDYQAIMQHPIFAPDRAPPPAEADAAGNLNGVEVLGTAIAGKTSAAALVRDAGGTISRVKIGEDIDGWKLVAIEPRQLTFDRNGEKRMLGISITAPRQTPGAPGAVGAQASESSSSDSDDDDSDQ